MVKRWYKDEQSGIEVNKNFVGLQVHSRIFQLTLMKIYNDIGVEKYKAFSLHLVCIE